METITGMGKIFSGLCALIVPYQSGGMGLDEHSSK